MALPSQSASDRAIHRIDEEAEITAVEGDRSTPEGKAYLAGVEVGLIRARNILSQEQRRVPWWARYRGGDEDGHDDSRR